MYKSCLFGKRDEGKEGLKLLIVDDSKTTLKVFRAVLEDAGYDVETKESAKEAFEFLGLDTAEDMGNDVDLVIMGHMMRGIDGIEATIKLKASGKHVDIPIIMVTAKTDDDSLRESFEAGVADYINKNFNQVELLAKVRSLVKLKQEMDHRKEVATQLEKANRHLHLLSVLDGLTDIPNRRALDNFMKREWKRAMREPQPISLIMVDIDNFKPYNDNYGHQMGDIALKKVASALTRMVNRPGDIVARYGGEEFTIVLVNTEAAGAKIIAEYTRSAVASLNIPHEYSTAGDHLTISLGVSTLVPEKGSSPKNLIENADKALYQAKEGGRNQVKVFAKG